MSTLTYFMMVTASFRLVEGFSGIPYKEFSMVYNVYSCINNKLISLEIKKLIIYKNLRCQVSRLMNAETTISYLPCYFFKGLDVKAGREGFDTENNKRNEEVAFIFEEGYHRPVG